MISFNDMQQLNQKDKTIIITGANSGIGFEAAKHFAKNQAHVILCSRNTQKGEQAKQAIVSEFPHATVDVMTLDLADLTSVDLFVEAFKKTNTLIDILLNNAGIMATPYGKTKDGFEQQIGVNHLGHFYLTSKLMPLMKENSRIVNVSSMAYLQGKVDTTNFMFENGGYSPFKSYARSKLANVLFTLELSRRLERAHKHIKVVSAHPGIAKTGLFDRKKQNSIIAKIVRVFSSLVPSAYDGAKPIIVACAIPAAQNGDYYGPFKQRKNKGDTIRLETINDIASDRKNQQFLWEYSIEKTNSDFSI